MSNQYYITNFSTFNSFFKYLIDILLFVLSFFLFYLLVLKLPIVFCSPNLPSKYLKCTWIINKKVRSYLNVNDYILHEIVCFMKNNNFNINDFTICKFFDPNLFSLPHDHPFKHYYINYIDFQNKFPNHFINFQLSSKNFDGNCFYLSDYNLKNKHKIQYLADKIYVYGRDRVNKITQDSKMVADFFKKLELPIIKKIKLVKNSYDI